MEGGLPSNGVKTVYQSDLELGWERAAFLQRVPWLK